MFSLTAPDRFCNFSYNCNNIFTAKLCSLLDQRCIYTSFIKYNLDNSGTVSYIYKTRPPLLRFFCTHPIMVTVSPTLTADSSPHLWVLFKPCIDSAIFYISFSLVPFYSLQPVYGICITVCNFCISIFY